MATPSHSPISIFPPSAASPNASLSVHQFLWYAQASAKKRAWKWASQQRGWVCFEQDFGHIYDEPSWRYGVFCMVEYSWPVPGGDAVRTYHDYFSTCRAKKTADWAAAGWRDRLEQQRLLLGDAFVGVCGFNDTGPQHFHTSR